MAGQISVSVDDDIYELLLDLKGSSGVSLSQCANRLMRAGMNYGAIGELVTDTDSKIDTVMDILVGFVESQGQGKILEDLGFTEER